MTARIHRITYLLRSAIGFSMAVAGCIVLDLVILPRLRPTPGPSALSDVRAQRAIHRVARGYMRFLSAIGWFRLEVHDGDRLLRDGPHLIVANHPSLLDFVVLASIMPQADCIVSSAWTSTFPLRGLATSAAYVRDDDPALLVRECAARLRAGRSVVVFPEGTRSPAHGLGPFRRGSARIALEVGCALLPVHIHWDPPVLYKGSRWRNLPNRRIHATVRVLEPVQPKPADGGPRDGGPDGGPEGQRGSVTTSVASRQLMAELRDVFLEVLESEGLESKGLESKGLESDDVRNA